MTVASVKSSCRIWLPGIGTALLGAFVLLVLSYRVPAADDQVALVFAPGTTANQTVEAVGTLGGQLVRPGSLANIVIAHFEAPVAATTLARAGVWLSLDPLALGGCLVGTWGTSPLENNAVQD
jgi:hypothetical protein